MVRIVADDGMIKLDDTGRAAGRGGYLHSDSRCLESFAASKKKEIRSLRVGIDRSRRVELVEAIRRLDSKRSVE
jgi:predicted RNA-binding protein YlxR (DUF448 family)